MKNPTTQFLRLASLAMVLGGFVVTSHAQTPSVADDFETYSPGSFSTSIASAEPATIAAADTKTSAATILGPKDSSNKTKALQITASLVSPGFNVAGISWNPVTQPNGKNTDKDLSHYTLSFDVEIIEGASFAVDGLGLDVNVLGQQTNTGVSISPDVTTVVAKGGFKHITVTLDHNKQFLERPTLDPTDQSVRLEFNLVGSVNASIEQKVVIDNVRVSNIKP